ncbi:AraC family transcriptional regulator [Rhodococcus erythropolis]
MRDEVPTSEPSHQLHFRTSELNVAHEFVSKSFSEHEIHAPDEGALRFELNIAPSPRLVIGKMSYGTEVTLDGPPIEFAYHINIPEIGSSTVAQGGNCRTFRAGEAGVVFAPHHPVSIRWSADCCQHHIQLPRAYFEAHAAKLIGRPVDHPIEFDLTFDLNSDAARSLRATARFLYTELSQPSGLALLPAACRELESALMTQVLMTIPNQLTDTVRTHPSYSGTRRSKMQEALDYIEAHADAYLTTTDLAANLGISERSLQAGFQEFVGTSPNAYIRSVRLDRAHIDLIAGLGTVSQIAARWGFHHAGRFAHLYRERFGRLPSAAICHEVHPPSPPSTAIVCPVM